MRRFCLTALLLVVILAFPAVGHAADHVVLLVSPTRLPAFGSWVLDGRVVGADYGGGTEIFGVSLRRSFRHGLADELHGFRAAPSQTITFDGVRGRWDASLGAATVRMAVTATGAPENASESQGCRGAFVAVPVELRGTFTLRTKTKFFKTIRRSRLLGQVLYNRAGPVDCSPRPSTECVSARSLYASRPDGSAMVQSWSNDGGGMNVSFADRLGGSSAWYHVMWVYGFDPFSGQLPLIGLHPPRASPIQGAATFTAQATTTGPAACPQVSVAGTMTGTFRTRFVGWGPRLLALNSATGGYRAIG